MCTFKMCLNFRLFPKYAPSMYKLQHNGFLWIQIFKQCIYVCNDQMRCSVLSPSRATSSILSVNCVASELLHTLAIRTVASELLHILAIRIVNACTDCVQMLDIY